MDETIFDKVQEIDLKKTMEQSYIDYAMSVISQRALPDVRDGLKPVQRRVLYSMIELNNGPDKPHRKCARIVGDTMGKYHPHGDSSIYGALVNMAQEWSTHYPLVDGHGNFGSVDGDGAAAMRYTEARLSKIAMEMLADINKDTVNFSPNFDETEKEPDVLPCRFPNLLCNGTTGIAVGMASNIPPHNIKETIDAVVKMINNRIDENRDTEIEELMSVIQGPDFPTGATIIGRRGIEEAYRTGKGKIIVRAVTNIEPMQNGKNRIVVTELPYGVNKEKLIEKIAEETGFSKKFIEEYGEHAPGTNVFSYSFLGRDAMGVSMQDKIWMMQRKLILDLAEKESCVIVGRCADYALSDNPDCINVFIHADMDIRIKNVSKNLNITENKARDIINKTDKQRASYYNYYTSKKWGDSKSYNLSDRKSTRLNSSHSQQSRMPSSA